MARRAESTVRRETEVEAPSISRGEGRRHSSTVTVACKIPQGLRLQLQHKMKRPVPSGKTGHDEFTMEYVNVFGGDIHIVSGPAVPAMGGVPDGYTMPKLEAGFALTEVPRAFWEQWLEQNAEAEYVKNKMIFAFGDPADTKAVTRELEKKLSGMEPISREVDAKGRMVDRRIPKPLTASVGRVAPDVEREAERAPKD